jgi:hypothetical protein
MKRSFAERISRFGLRLRDPEWRRYGALLLAGKLIGIAVLLAIIVFANQAMVGTGVLAADAEIKASDVINPLNTVWTLLAAFLVFGMQVGFTMLEAGFCRSRETVNVLMECIVDTCLCGLLFFAFGFSFMFGHGNGFIGHWAWGPDGFLATMGTAGNFLPALGTGFHDFAGSTVVHTIGGFVALAGAIVLGPRLGRRFKRDGGAPMQPHDLTIAASGPVAPYLPQANRPRESVPQMPLSPCTGTAPMGSSMRIHSSTSTPITTSTPATPPSRIEPTGLTQ